MANRRYWNSRTGRYEDQPAGNISQGLQGLQAAQQATAAVNPGGGGGGAGGIASGALAGAGTGAALGSVVPGIGTAIGAGIGGLVGAVGAGMQGMEEDKRYQEGMAFRTRQQEEDEKQNRFMRGYHTRSQNMAGIGQLADMRTQAMANAKGRMFQDDLLRAISGR